MIGQMPEKGCTELFCEKCQKKLRLQQFYKYKDGSYTELCKNCLTLHIDNFKPETFKWALQKMDVPYIEKEWNVLRDRAFAKNPEKMNGLSVFGKYLSKMKLTQWSRYGWEDSEKLNVKFSSPQVSAEDVARKQEDLIKKYEDGEISESEYLTYIDPETQYEQYMNDISEDVIGKNNAFNEQTFLDESTLPLGKNYTEDEKIALALKWGRLYKPAEWEVLERKYNEMKKSFDIQDSDTEGALILICKTYLKMNTALDCGDLDGYQKLSRTYNDLRKTAKFTAAQNKESSSEQFDSVGSIIAFCEKEGSKIPRYEIDVDLDKADEAISILKKYLKELIYNDTNLAQQIENYLNLKAAQEQQKEDSRKAKEKGLDYVPITDEDMLEYENNMSKQEKENREMMLNE